MAKSRKKAVNNDNQKKGEKKSSKASKAKTQEPKKVIPENKEQSTPKEIRQDSKTSTVSETILKPKLGPKKDGVTISDSVVEVPRDAVLNAIKCLRKQLPEDASLQGVSLNFTLAQMPDTPYQSHVLIPVPNSINALGDTDICVIVPDGHKKEYEEKSELLDEVDKIIEFSAIMRHYPTYQQKRELASSYDLFLCDRRCSPQIGNYLGRTFRDKGKQPILIDLGHDGSNVGALVQSIDLIRNSVNFQVSTGKLCGVVLGRSDMSDEDLADNALPIFEGVQKFFTADADESHRNTIVKCDIKFRESKSIPLFAHKLVYSTK